MAKSRALEEELGVKALGGSGSMAQALLDSMSRSPGLEDSICTEEVSDQSVCEQLTISSSAETPQAATQLDVGVMLFPRPSPSPCEDHPPSRQLDGKVQPFTTTDPPTIEQAKMQK